MGRRRARVRAVACALVAVVAAAAACGGGPDVVVRVAVGERAPTFAAPGVDGQRVVLGDYEGQVVLLNFWASWCAPCREEFRLLRDVHGRDGVAVVGVVFDDSARRARAFMEERRATWASAVDPHHEISDAYGVFKKPGIPVTWLIDAQGVARARHLGPLSAPTLRNLLATPST